MPHLGVMSPLAAQARRDARPKDDRIEWLRQVILGAHLNAAGGARHLIDRGDHEDGQVLERLVRLQTRQDLVPVHLRHDDVEQHHVERISMEQLEPAPAVGRGLHAVAVALQQLCEHLAVDRVVVDDQDPRYVVAHRRSSPAWPASAARTSSNS
jgi:hypothetical protein